MSVSAVRAVASRKTWWAALLVALALTGALAPRAGAVLVHVGHGRVAGVLPVRGVTPAAIPGSFGRRGSSPSGAAVTPSANDGMLAYHHGAVVHAASPYLIFWDPSGAISSTEKANLEQYFADSAAASGVSSNIFGVDRQFTDSTGFVEYKQTWSPGQAITDTHPYPPRGGCTEATAGFTETNCLFDQQIQAEVQRVVAVNQWPTGTTGSAPIYFVVTPPTVNTCFSGNTTCADNFYCAYHSNFSATGSGADVLYANMPMLLAANDPKGCQSDGNATVQQPNGSSVTDVVTSSMSHEFSETVTDPLGTGWYDDASGNEDGDNCAFTGAQDPAGGFSPTAFLPTLPGGSATAGTLYDQLINSHHYYTQTEWSNAGLTCLARPTSSPIHASFTGPSSAAAGDPNVQFDSTGSSTGNSSTTWSFGDGGTAFTQGDQTTVKHKFNPVHAVFGYAPSHPRESTMVTFNGSPSSFSTSDMVALTLVDRYGNVALATHSITLTGAGSSSLSYSWDFGDGSAGTGVSPTHMYATSGSYTVTLTVSNGTTIPDITSQVVRVDAPATASYTAITPTATFPTNFDASGSGEVNGGLVDYSWNFGDGSIDNGRSLTHTYAAPGSYTVSLTVTDQDGYTATTTQAIVVGSPPAATFSVSTPGPQAGSPVAFDGSGSNEPGGSISSYSWNFGDASGLVDGVAPAHVYSSAGTYSVSLTVTDANGYPSSVSRTVTVANPSPTAPNRGSPAAMISVATRHPIAGAAVAFSGSGSSDQGSTLAAYNWSFGDSGLAIGVTPGHRYAHPGTYSVTLTVRDATGTTAATSRRVTVRSAGITGVKVKTGKTVERLKLSLSGPGTLSSGKLKFKIQGAGNFAYKLKLSEAQRGRLSHHHPLKIRLTFKFKPKVGSSSSRTVSFKVRG